MSIDKTTVWKAFESLRKHVHGSLSDHNLRVKAIQFLLPGSHKLNSIRRFHYCAKGSSRSYEEASNCFVYGTVAPSPTAKVIRSLYYQEFDPLFMYSCYGQHLAAPGEDEYELLSWQFDNRQNPPVDVRTDEIRELRDETKLGDYWGAWTETLKSACFGQSTLWTYITVQGRAERRVSSAIIVFDGLDHSKDAESLIIQLSKVSKRAQEALYFLTLRLFEFEIRRNATRAAISQVMARNMSHNLGSHVSYRATNTAIKHRIEYLYEDALSEAGSGCGKSVRQVLNETSSIIEWIDAMSGSLDKYEIRRNEYLADFDLSPQNFALYRDVLLPFCESTLILDNLASSEGACYSLDSPENRLKIRVFIRREGEESFTEIKANYQSLECDLSRAGDPQKDITYPDYFPYLLKSTDAKVPFVHAINARKFIGAKDIDVVLHSEQAMYSILENLIRNSAKHNKEQFVEKPLEIRIHLDDFGDRFKCTISDNVSALRPVMLFNEDPAAPGLFQRMHNELVGDDETPTRQNLGFADICVNSFLFKHRASEISDRPLWSNCSLVTLSDCADDVQNQCIQGIEGRLEGEARRRFGFTLELLKPKRILWIGENIEIGEGRQVSDFESEGVVRYQSLAHFNLEASSADSISTFDFVIFDHDFDYERYLSQQVTLPSRVLVTGKQPHGWKPNVRPLHCAPKDITSGDDLVSICWQAWLDGLEKPVRAYVYYETRGWDSDAAVLLHAVGALGSHNISSVNCLHEKVTLSDESIAIIYDQHGKARTSGKLLLEGGERRPTTNFYSNHTKLVFDKGSDDYTRLMQLPDNLGKRRLLAYELIDAAATNVFIIDERLAIRAAVKCRDAQDKAIGVKGPYDDLMFSRYCYGNVFPISLICSRGRHVVVGTDSYQLAIQIETDSIAISSVEDPALCQMGSLRKDVLIIHRTYLKDDVFGMSIKAFLDLAGRAFGTVIVTSGGGYPHNITEPVRFMPFSVIEQCVGARLAKVKLVNWVHRIVCNV